MKTAVRQFSTVICAASALAAMALPVEIEECSIDSKALGREVGYSVILPEGALSGHRYPVLYLFHGIGGDKSSWMEYGDMARVMQRMVDAGEIEPMIVVSPDGYLSYYSDAADGSMPYERFLIEELVPAVDSIYPTIADRGHRAVGGFSMGGFGALSCGLRNRGRFSAIAALSPSIRTDSQYCAEGPQEGWDKQWGRTFGGAGLSGEARLTPYYKARSPYHIIDTIPVRELDGMTLILDIGDSEGTLTASNEQLHRRLRERGIAHTYTVRDGGHDFECWNAAMPDALRLISAGFASETRTARSPFSPDSVPAQAAPVAVSGSEIYLPVQNPQSRRKYPVVYLRGEFSPAQRAELAQRAGMLVREGRTAPMALCFLAAEDTPEAIELAMPALRGTQRMRALVAVGVPVAETNRLHRDANMFTAIILSEPRGNESEAYETAAIVKSHRRYPRLWIEQRPDAEDYPLASRLHILLRDQDLRHEFRVALPEPDKLLPHWEEWLVALDKRIHI
ncbi:MAG: esterase family protein [Muribaculaceae bacterium]|nr:esterase family protein [Muribaculaceae bacterium]